MSDGDHAHGHSHGTVESEDDAALRALVEDARGPGDEDGPVFEAPWQARAFSLAVTLDRDGDHIQWDAFQERLAGHLEEEGLRSDSDVLEEDYYRRWLGALEDLLVEEGVIDTGELAERAAEFEAGDRTAEEFVEGHHEH